MCADGTDFGIIALEVYFPRYFIDQSALELADDCVGKYTKGLGQEALGVCSVEEDISSICLTVVTQLVSRLKLDLRTVGFLEVGSETLIDKSKSTKSVLMQLFEECGNTDVEGVDVKNACFGGTAALFHALNWLESRSWDGRLALVVAADIAVYGTRAARPTGGAGAVAILLGPNAPLIIEPGLRAHHITHRYDFYKPDLSSEYPVVDGKLSLQCYQEALLACYRLYKDKVKVKTKTQHISVLSSTQEETTPPTTYPESHRIDFMCFHSPYTRLVRKAFGWLALDDVRSSMTQGSNGNSQNGDCHLSELASIDPTVIDPLRALVKLEQTSANLVNSREFDSQCMQTTTTLFATKVEPSLTIAKQVGNMYTASLYTCLASLLLGCPEYKLRGARVLLYSYGSGFASAMFSLRFHPKRPLSGVLYDSTLLNGSKTTSSISGNNNPIFHRLFHERTRLNVSQFEELLDERRRWHNAASFTPIHRPDGLFPHVFHLLHVDEQYRREYQRHSPLPPIAAATAAVEHHA